MSFFRSYRRADGLLSVLLRGGAVSMGTRIAGMGLGFAAHMLLARMLGVQAYGQYALLLSWALLLVAPVKMGMDQAVLKFAAGYWQNGQPGLLSALARTSLGVVLAGAVVMGAAVIGLSALFPGLLGAQTLGQAGFLAILIALLSLLGTFSVFFRAAQKIFASQVFGQVLRQVLVIAALLFCLGLGLRLNLDLALAITTGAVGLSLLWMLIVLRARLLRAPPAPQPPRRDWMGVALPLLVATIFQEMVLQSNTLLLGWLGTSAQVAHFSVAARLAGVVPFVLVAMNAIAGPMVAGAWARQDQGELHRLAQLTTRLSFGAGLGIALALVLGGKWALGLFGPEYPQAYPVLLVLLAGGLINAATAATGPLITMTNMQRQSLWTGLLALLTAILACVLLIPGHGAIGAAIAASLAMTVRATSRMIWIWVQLGIDSSPLGLHRRPRG